MSLTCTKTTKNSFGRYVLHHSTPFHSFLLGNLEILVRMRKDTNLNAHPGPPTAGSGPGENFLRGLQQGWTGMGKSEETKKTASYARWPLAESTVNTTKSPGSLRMILPRKTKTYATQSGPGSR